MGLNKKQFGTLDNGTPIYLYILENKNGMKAEIMNYGAILQKLFVKGKDGQVKDVVLGYEKLEDYYINEGNQGATIGPNANRIGKAAFTLDGVRYELDKNDGPNNLHSHAALGYHKKVWEVTELDQAVEFYLEDEDGSMGFPGNKRVWVTYTLSEENELIIKYRAVSDKNTILNLTNHSYFNLAGHDAGTIFDHALTLHASAYTPVAEGSIPTGEIAPVAGTPMDFTKEKRIGDEIDAAFEQLQIAGGYDHNWVLDGEAGTLRHIATVTEKSKQRIMEVYTDLPGVQFYAGNFMNGHLGKDGAVYNKRCGLCLETQYFPDTANKPEFPSAVFGPEREYESTTIYRFT